ncbi:MAG TPA: DedA family protein [Burkholderiaceae bacterium]|nr:DedA family protein [Burkholderiaceae bacterium]
MSGFGAWQRAALVLVLLASLAVSIASGVRSWRTMLLLQSAQAAGVPQTSALRAWMPLGFVAATHRIDEALLRQQLGLGTEVESTQTLRAIAEGRNVAAFEFVQTVQAAIALARGQQRAAPAPDPPDPPAEPPLSERLLATVASYGLLGLALALLLGAVGLPVPTGLATIFAGALAMQGRLDATTAIAVAVAASLLGDLIGYGIGRAAGAAWIERHGRWFGYTRRNRERVAALFDRWGAITVLLTRTLVSHLSSAVSVLAGLGRYQLARFVALAASGRVLWTVAYFSLGYLVGTDLEAASGFLGSLSAFLISSAILMATAAILLRDRLQRVALG